MYRRMPFWQSILVWVVVGLMASFIHRGITGDPLDTSSYFAGLVVAVVASFITDEY